MVKKLTNFEWHGDILLSPDYWECGCIDNFVHEDEEEYCPLCLETKDNCPDARVVDIIKQKMEKA